MAITAVSKTAFHSSNLCAPAQLIVAILGVFDIIQRMNLKETLCKLVGQEERVIYKVPVRQTPNLVIDTQNYYSRWQKIIYKTNVSGYRNLSESPVIGTVDVRQQRSWLLGKWKSKNVVSSSQQFEK